MVIANILRVVLAVQFLLGAALGYALFIRGYADPYVINWVLVIAFGLLAIPFGHAVVLLVDFLISDAVDKRVHDRSGASAWLTAYFNEIRDSVRVFAWLQPFFPNKRIAMPERSQLDKLPVLFLHGYHCNRAMWLPLAKHLRKNPVSGARVLDAITMEPAFGSIDRYADSIHERVKKIHSKTGKKSVLICHSMGGLAARAYLREHGSDYIAGIITLGTPHQGTFLAYFGHGTNTHQMRLNNFWLGDLANSEQKRKLPPFEVVLSLHDNIVSPRALQTIPAANTQIVEGLGHMSLALDRDIWRQIDQQLKVWDSAF